MEHFDKLLSRSRRVLLYSRDCIRKVLRVYTEIVYAEKQHHTQGAEVTGQLRVYDK